MTAIVVPAGAVVCVVAAGYYYLKLKHDEAVHSIPVPKLPVDNRIERLPEPSYLKANKTEKKGEGTKKKKKEKSGREEDKKKDDKKSGRSAGEEDKKKEEKKSRKGGEEDKKKDDKKDDHKEEKKDDKKEKQTVI